MSDRRRPPIDEVERHLVAEHGAPVRGLRPIDGGFWSSAYAYDVGDEPFVLRLADADEGYRIDRAAHAFDSPRLPVPEVVVIGEAFGGAFAISRRAEGAFLEDLPADDAAWLGPVIDELLTGLRNVDAGNRVEWWAADERDISWADRLAAVLDADFQRAGSRWAEAIAAHTHLGPLALATRARFDELVARCPERRDLVHGDLLHQNVLVDTRERRVTAVFSWKCSALGDFLYDVAWCGFWGPWHPGVEAADPWQRIAQQELTPGELHDAAVRHHCYELHIGAQHLAWCAWTGDQTSLAEVAARTRHVLDRGPLPPAGRGHGVRAPV